MFAVIKTGGKQYRVAADDTLIVGKIEANTGDIVTIGEVLLVGEGDSATVGTPLVEGASVAAEVVKQGRHKTVIAFKKRRRQNSRRKRGQRQHETTLRITEILTGGARPSVSARGSADAEAPAPQIETATPAPASTAQEATPLFSAPAQPADDLVVITGIGKVAAQQLKDQGLTTFAQLAALTEEDIARIDANMPFSSAQIRDWQEQAKKLANQ